MITVVVFFKSGLLEGQVMLENSKGFLGTFNEVVEQIIWKKKKKDTNMDKMAQDQLNFSSVSRVLWEISSAW